MKSERTIETTDEHVSATIALVVMNQLENHSLMRFTIAVLEENLASKAGTLIDTAASLNFASKKFLNANGLYKYCKAALKLAVRVATEQLTHLNEQNIISHILFY
jgi:hypothetical protein